MKVCPVCSERGIGEHSVLIDLRPDPDASREDALAAFTRCARCNAGFRFDGPDTLVRETRLGAREHLTWIAPPWVDRDLASEMALSWDKTERALLGDLGEDESLQPLHGLIEALRERGIDRKLRAAYGKGSVLLTRATAEKDGARVLLDPQLDGSLFVRARLARPLTFGPVPARDAGDLRLVLDTLLATPGPAAS